METVKLFRMTSDEAPEPALNSFQGGGGMKYALPALPQQPALNLFQGRLLCPGRVAFQRKGHLPPCGLPGVQKVQTVEKKEA